MKKFSIILIVIIALGGVIYYVTRDNSSQAPVETTQNGNNDAGRDPSNATFIFDGTPVTLSNGKGETSVGSFVEETDLLDKIAYGDLNNDGKNDTALLLAQYGSGSGTFIYAAAYVSGPVSYKGTEAIFIGDRIAPQSISISQGIVTVNYLDRKPDDPMSEEPTIPKSMKFVYSNGSFQER